MAQLPLVEFLAAALSLGASSRYASCRGWPVCQTARYRRREPEKSVLYQVVRDNLETFLERARDPETGSRLPGFVIQELRDYLDCGILANGFARIRCGDCGDEKLVGFS